MAGIIHREKKLIYWPVPKNACTTVKAILADDLGISRPNPHFAEFETVPVGEAWKYASYSHIAIIRNPFDRLVSCYRDKIRKGRRTKGFPNGVEYTLAPFGFSENMTFSAFANKIFDSGIKNEHWDIQAGQIPQKVDVLIDFDVIEHELPFVLAQLGFCVKELERRNASKRPEKHYSELYGPILESRAKMYYDADCKRFGYNFERI